VCCALVKYIFSTLDNCCRLVEGHNDAIAAVAFSPDSQYLVTVCSDGHMKLWCVAPCSEQCLLTQEDAHDLGVVSCDFSPIEGTAGNSGDMFRKIRIAFQAAV
jgi:WD40 repeat protein